MEISNPDIEVLLPVYNEEASIEKVIREIYNDFSRKLKCQFIICEDGSKDNTEEVVKKLSKEIPMKLVMSPERKGYSQAVKDGMMVLSAPFLLCLDSDGQCDPKDFWKFWEIRNNFDVILGRRVNRHDAFWRLLFSRTFYCVYKLFFNTPFHDPSCPYMLARKSVVEDLALKMGAMQEGFWWEFSARVVLSGYKTKEIDVNHRDRFFGKTQVYRFNKIAHIGFYHFLALFKISKQVKNDYAITSNKG
jgi:glycosyltransferase involved in cell wall biosynthesis